ncbi:MAG: Helix-turn-helix domain protein [bacterium ADurb.BinA186]|nr:MAG: Helix-turn-helix domain protein [bacterium ADurb.BinA186]
MANAQNIEDSFDDAIKKLQAEKERMRKAAEEAAKQTEKQGFETIFTKKEVASILKFSERQIDRLIAAGKLKKIPSGVGKAVRIRTSELSRFIEGGKS